MNGSLITLLISIVDTMLSPIYESNIGSIVKWQPLNSRNLILTDVQTMSFPNNQVLT